MSRDDLSRKQDNQGGSESSRPKKVREESPVDFSDTNASSSTRKTATKEEQPPPSSKNRSQAASSKDIDPKEPGWFDRIGNLTSSALRIARKTTDGSVKVGKTILKSQDQLKVMVAAGQSLKDLREVAGLTIAELGDAINLKDRTFWEAVEDGTATISFELILRLAALLARNDPVPFILKYTRTYNPDLWRILNDWGLGRLPLHYEREREFINIYRRHDAARNLSDEGFAKVLSFTRQSFEMALHFAAEQEQLTVAKLKEADLKKADNKDLARSGSPASSSEFGNAKKGSSQPPSATDASDDD